MRVLRPLTLDRDGVSVKRYPSIAAPAFRRLEEETYAKFRPGLNASNQLDRGIAWGAYVRDQFIWTDRTTYSLPAKLNPEEGGRIRQFVRIDDAFLKAPEIEAVLRDVFQHLGFPETSFERAYEVQLSAIRYEPRLDKPAFPAPIAPHQDLIDGAVLVVNKTGAISGGASRIYDLDGEPTYELDLDVGEALFIRDDRVLHQVTPILMVPNEQWRPGDRAYRDILIIRFQALGR